MPIDPRITALIPHRDPFLWVDRIITEKPGSIATEKDIPTDLDIFRGHYPDMPILPGVLLCEAVFQSGALLIARMRAENGSNPTKLPVITKINSARFKRPVHPGDTLQIEVELKETVSTAHFLKATVRVQNKIALRIEFAATFAEQSMKNIETL
jgi:3-hydroxyacyl-[acyl-carrier-protein] dehydratase